MGRIALGIHAVLKTLVQSLLAAFPALCNVLYFAIFAFTFFAIVGNQLYQGTLRGRCFYTHPESKHCIGAIVHATSPP